MTLKRLKKQQETIKLEGKTSQREKATLMFGDFQVVQDGWDIKQEGK